VTKSNEQSNVNATQSNAVATGINLSAPGAQKALAARIKADIDRYCVETYDDGHRWHLGSSLLGRDCARYLWYVFRWCHHEKTDGRQQRLFNRGHREEARFIEWLKGIGCTTWNETPDGKQYRISGVMGHYGGSLDGILELPARYGVNVAAFLNEFKTSGTGAKFNELCSKGVKIAKYEHYAQMCQYGRKYGFEYAVYMSINKNDDDLHVEIVKLDWSIGEEMERKAEFIILSQEAPKKLSESPAYKDCSYCGMKGICHGNDQVERNCRSCKNAKPVENGEWHCMIHRDVIPREFVPKACDRYDAIA
jgi:hypothetical protein